MSRLPDWRSRLGHYLDSLENESFEYGVNDCCLFGAGAVEAITGEDPASTFRGKYSTRLGGIRKLRAAGYDNAIDFLEKNFAETPRSFARQGDLGIIETDEGPAIVVIAGSFVLGLDETGLKRLPVNLVTRAFSVGGIV